MQELLETLDSWRGRRLWLVCAGSEDDGDDAFGPRLAAALRSRLGGKGPGVRVVDAGLCPERFVGPAVRAGCEELVFADAVDFGAPPGTVFLAATSEVKARPLATPTHRVPISVLAQYAESLGVRAWLLGVEPDTLCGGSGLSAPVASAVDSLTELFAERLGAPIDVPGASP